MRRTSSAVPLLLLPIVFGKLLRINEWYGLNLPESKTATLRLNFFYSCDGASIVVKTGCDLSTRLHLYFDAESLEKIDVESARVSTFPQTYRIIGGCREKERKSLALNITATGDFFELHVDGQVFKRPKAKTKADYLEIGLPQETPCCIIRAWIKTEDNMAVTEVETTELATTSLMSSTTQELSSITRKKANSTTTLKNEPVVPTTASQHEYKASSWTEIVNREWSISFLVCAGVTCTLMTALVIFGIASWGWLLTKPRDAQMPYRVDTPASVF